MACVAYLGVGCPASRAAARSCAAAARALARGGAVVAVAALSPGHLLLAVQVLALLICLLPIFAALFIPKRFTGRLELSSKQAAAVDAPVLLKENMPPDSLYGSAYQLTLQTHTV